MSDTWRIVIVALAAGVVIEGVVLVAVMRQIGELLLRGAPGSGSVHVHGPKLGSVVEIPGREPNGVPAVVVFTSSGCDRCKVLMPGLQRMYAAYGPHAGTSQQLDVIAVLTDSDPATREQHARELGDFSRTDLVALTQDWDVPGTPFAVALDAEQRVKGAEVVNTRLQLEMFVVQKLEIVWEAPPEAVIDASALQIQHVSNGDSRKAEVLP